MGAANGNCVEISNETRKVVTYSILHGCQDTATSAAECLSPANSDLHPPFATENAFDLCGTPSDGAVNPEDGMIEGLGGDHPYDDYRRWQLETLNHKLHFACGKGQTCWIKKALVDGADIEARRHPKGNRMYSYKMPRTVGQATDETRAFALAEGESEQERRSRVVVNAQSSLHDGPMAAPCGESGAGERAQPGITPIMRAAQGGHSEAVQTLVDFRADLEATSEMGRTALHMAASSGSRETCLVLLRGGASRRALDIYGSDALDCLPDGFVRDEAARKDWENLLRPAGRWAHAMKEVRAKDTPPMEEEHMTFEVTSAL